MRYLPSLRSVPSFRLRLGPGVRLLLGSAGLALASAGLLAFAMPASRAVHIPWATATTTGLPTHELSRRAPAGTGFQLLATQAPAMQLGYGSVGSRLRQGHVGLLPGPAPYRFALGGPRPAQPYAATAVSPVSLVQRAWLTVKMMFR